MEIIKQICEMCRYKNQSNATFPCVDCCSMDRWELAETIVVSSKDIEAQQQEIDRLKKKLNAVLQDFYQYVQGGKEICAFCLHDYECEPGETICGATYKGFKWRGLNEREGL